MFFRIMFEKISIDDFYNYLGNVKTARIVNTPPHIASIAEKIVYEIFL